MKQLNTPIRDDQHDWLRREAFGRKLSMAEVVRDIIDSTMVAGCKITRWTSEAVKVGGTGLIYCNMCAIANVDGFGSAACEGCRVAERQFPGREIECWNPAGTANYAK